jgi:hypothetical protein
VQYILAGSLYKYTALYSSSKSFYRTQCAGRADLFELASEVLPKILTYWRRAPQGRMVDAPAKIHSRFELLAKFPRGYFNRAPVQSTGPRKTPFPALPPDNAGGSGRERQALFLRIRPYRINVISSPVEDIETAYLELLQQSLQRL